VIEALRLLGEAREAINSETMGDFLRRVNTLRPALDAALGGAMTPALLLWAVKPHAARPAPDAGDANCQPTVNDGQPASSGDAGEDVADVAEELLIAYRNGRARYPWDTSVLARAAAEIRRLRAEVEGECLMIQDEMLDFLRGTQNRIDRRSAVEVLVRTRKEGDK